MRVGSGINGIASRSGSYHAEDLPGLTYTFWGGATDTFPVGGYTTSVFVYLNLAAGATNDTRFDFSSAVNNPAGSHRRDFVFNGGFYNDSDATGTGPRFVFSASNGAGRANSYPKNPVRDPFAVTTSGWYELRHVFSDNGAGVLTVDLELRSNAGALLNSWTLSDPTDVIGTTVGGNRYGWFVNQEFSVLAFDDTSLSLPVPSPTSKDDCKKDGWKNLDRADGSTFKNQGDCIQYANTGK